ncbi:hypothetical protein [Ornithinimicrobium cavernae]|uniref:hypothetical protein n=1 Tax=Ornithinimicrobium cavernae TaxID=2666047 RepID=UPI0012B1717E|nr:hypothetical protein [Ornithinimicrobium cavernae]
MRPIPRFWATAEGEASDSRGRALALRIWGWSTTSAADAAQVAAQRLTDVRARLASGAELQPWKYYPRMPLREETLAEITGADGRLLAVVTRNRYGAEVLNTDLFLIADIDLPEPARAPGAGGRLLSRLFGRRQEPSAAVPTPEQEALERVARFAAARPDLGVQTYRTAAGLRVLVTGGDLPPGTPASEGVLGQLQSDPVYQLLCATHQTYRARLTPKPWRCGHRALSVSWPYEERSGEAAQWQARYEERSAQFATVRRLSVAGPPPTDEEAQVIAWHDRVARATEDLPLA